MRSSRPKSQRQYAIQNDAAAMAAKLPGTTGARMPSFIGPCLATLRDNVPSGARWLHEIKFDGYRLQLHKRENDTRLYTRRGNNWTKRFPYLVEAAWHLPATHLILDGEVVVETRIQRPSSPPSKVGFRRLYRAKSIKRRQNLWPPLLCPRLAQSGHALVHRTCPLLGEADIAPTGH